MKPAIAVIVAALFSCASSVPVEVDEASKPTKLHFYVLMIPDETVQEVVRARQEEDTLDTVSETGVYVGQIISGVLGGDVRPIFAGSASFIGEPDVQQGVSTILANVAPSLNNIVKQWVNRAQLFLGLHTTPKPGTNSTTLPSNGAIAGQPPNGANPASLQLTTAQLQQQLALLQQTYAHTPETIPGTNIVSASDLNVASTVAPLPIIKLKPDEDEEESVVKTA